ncbi:hypothetical protein [Bifidobacterium vansinderenii]|uniref:hypothetical protein n=1 Tax=Bifidobacterium vansinderenii TaxID=1984871 RepID=UPI00117805CC|nr:hypothetical protein [Bifidobacterium vansinderenii]
MKNQKNPKTKYRRRHVPEEPDTATPPYRHVDASRRRNESNAQTTSAARPERTRRPRMLTGRSEKPTSISISPDDEDAQSSTSDHGPGDAGRAPSASPYRPSNARTAADATGADSRASRGQPPAGGSASPRDDTRANGTGPSTCRSPSNT